MYLLTFFRQKNRKKTRHGIEAILWGKILEKKTRNSSEPTTEKKLTLERDQLDLEKLIINYVVDQRCCYIDLSLVYFYMLSYSNVELNVDSSASLISISTCACDADQA